MGIEIIQKDYLEQHAGELARDDHEGFKGNRLKSLKIAIQHMDVPEIDFGNIAKTPQQHRLAVVRSL